MVKQKMTSPDSLGWCSIHKTGNCLECALNAHTVKILKAIRDDRDRDREESAIQKIIKETVRVKIKRLFSRLVNKIGK